MSGPRVVHGAARNVLLASAIGTCLVGLGLLIFPEQLAQIFNLSLDPSGILVARIFGGQFIGLGMLDWWGSRGDATLQRFALQPRIVAWILSAGGAIWAAPSAGGNALVWGLPVLFLAFAVARIVALARSAAPRNASGSSSASDAV